MNRTESVTNFVSICVVWVLLLMLFTPPVWGQQQITDPGMYGYPLKYQRVMDYQHPYPDVEGFYIQQLGDESRPAKAGLEDKQIVVSINGEDVRTQSDVVEAINERDTDPVTVTTYEIAPRFQQKINNNPYFDPSQHNIYRTDSYKVSYQEAEPEQITVYQVPGGHLYHRTGFEHSPDRDEAKSYANPELASGDGLRACPICFPEDSSSLVGEVLKEEVGDAPDFVNKLKSKHETVREVPESLKTVGVKLFRQRLRQDITPRMIMIDTSKFHGFGIENGTILFSRGLHSLMEGEGESAALVAHLMAHMDLKHDPVPVQKARFQSLIERAIDRTTGVSVTFSDLKKYSPKIPGFRFYSELIEQGYGEHQEREAMFFAMVYMYRAGMDMESIARFVRKSNDMQSNVHSKWLEYILKHPLPNDLERDLSEWRDRIPEEFDQNLSP